MKTISKNKLKVGDIFRHLMVDHYRYKVIVVNPTSDDYKKYNLYPRGSDKLIVEDIDHAEYFWCRAHEEIVELLNDINISRVNLIEID